MFQRLAERVGLLEAGKEVAEEETELSRKKLTLSNGVQVDIEAVDSDSDAKKGVAGRASTRDSNIRGAASYSHVNNMKSSMRPRTSSIQHRPEQVSIIAMILLTMHR